MSWKRKVRRAQRQELSNQKALLAKKREEERLVKLAQEAEKLRLLKLEEKAAKKMKEVRETASAAVTETKEDF